MENKKYIIYKHTFPNGKFYIGKTCQNPLYRWKKNGKGYNHNKKMWEDIQKYGWENIKHEILYENLTKEEASELEYKLVDKNNENCYNRCIGGEQYFVYVKGEKMYLSEIAENAELNPLGLTRKEIRNRIFNHKNSRNFDLERALSQPKGVKDQPFKNKYEYKGNMYTLKELSELSPWKISTTLLRDRINNCGFSIERAVEQKPRKR